MKKANYLSEEEQKNMMDVLSRFTAGFTTMCDQEKITYPVNVQTFTDKMSYVAENCLDCHEGFIRKEDAAEEETFDQLLWAGVVAIPLDHLTGDTGLHVIYRPDEVAKQEVLNTREFRLDADKISDLPETFLLVWGDGIFEVTFIQLNEDEETGALHVGGMQYLFNGNFCEDCGLPKYSFVQLPETDFYNGDSIADIMDRTFHPGWTENVTLEHTAIINNLAALEYIAKKSWFYSHDTILFIHKAGDEEDED